MSNYSTNKSEYSSYPLESEQVKYESAVQESYRCKNTCKRYGICTCK